MLNWSCIHLIMINIIFIYSWFDLLIYCEGYLYPRWWLLVCGFLAMILFGCDVRVVLISFYKLQSIPFPSSFWKKKILRIVLFLPKINQWNHLSLQFSLWEYWRFFYSNYLIDKGKCRLYVFDNFEDLSLNNLFHLSCHIYWNRVIHNSPLFTF